MTSPSEAEIPNPAGSDSRPSAKEAECEGVYICSICGKVWTYTGLGHGHESHHARIVDLQLAIVRRDAELAALREDFERAFELLEGRFAFDSEKYTIPKQHYDTQRFLESFRHTTEGRVERRPGEEKEAQT